MCGIAGIYSKYNVFRELSEKVSKMIQIQAHRGPDGTGYYNDDNISLGHCRLAIIDLTDSAKQPMSNEDKTIWITYNEMAELT